MKYRSCGVCGNKNVEKLHNLKFKLPDEINLPDNYDIVICPECTFIYADTSATQKDYDEFYRNHNIYENPASFSDIEKYKLTFKTLRQNWGDREKSILDIGFANGQLLNIFKEDGYKNLFGLDPSESCVKNLNGKGVKTYQGSLLNHNIDRKFDNIILSHVMEHILDIPEAMRSIRNLLNDNGMVYIEVPDVMQYEENNALPFNFFDIEHIGHFNEVSLVNLYHCNDLTVIDRGTKKWYIGNDQYYPAVWILGCRKELDNSYYVERVIKKYINNCLERKFNEINNLIKTQEPIIVWGTGSLCQRLYSMSDLYKCNIKMFIDNNKNKQGKFFCGEIIQSPQDIKDNYSILILSVYGAKDIEKQLKDMGLKNKIIHIKVGK